MRCLAVMILVVGGCAHTEAPPLPTPAPETPARPPALEAWARKNPDPARQLGEWVKRHPAGAMKLFLWDGKHPRRSRELVTWAIANPLVGLDGFVVTHGEWQGLNELLVQHASATDAFLGWCRKNPRAAESLMQNAKGLEWVGRQILARQSAASATN